VKRIRLLLLIPVLLAILAAVRSNGQAKELPGQPELSKFSDDQLKACFDDSKVCGTSDAYQISDELVGRLPKLSSDQLVACFDDWKICGTGEDQASGWPISDELAHRGHIHELLVRYWTEPKWTIRDGIEHVAYHFDTPEITEFMRRVVAEQVYDGEDRYWPVNYLAKKCDAVALHELNGGGYRNQGGMQYEHSVALFGKCKYRPAIPYLVDTAVYDMSLNVVDAADQSLHALYPGSPKEFHSLDSMQKYYCSRAKQEGLRVNCTEK
jgi:hypothetical protein